METDRNKPLTPAEFYKTRRPEYFSDSKISYDVLLTREQLAFELAQISKNQKQDQFETLCRRLAEKFISPNLIPQVGPTGGGDAKVDSETYPVSTAISDRWFIPKNGWANNEKWGFAFSAKLDWRSKVTDDVDKIVNTARGYTRVYFITNQTPSSKKRAEAQDALKSAYKIDITILDGEWILEKIFTHDLIDLVVDSLSLSDVYKQKSQIPGPNDTARTKRLEELEGEIATVGRYGERDFQLVEDCLEAALLARMLERPREEVDGKFERAVRFCKQVNSHKQWLRIHYQRAWTNLNWYDDIDAFIAEFRSFKLYISETSGASDLELYVNLYNLLRGATASEGFNLNAVSLDSEKQELINALTLLEADTERLCSALVAKTYKSVLLLMDDLFVKDNSKEHLLNLASYLESSRGFIEFPFERIKGLLEVFGDVLPDSPEFDSLVNTIGSISEARSSELAAGETFLRRGMQKLEADLFNDSIIFFGKAVLKLAKEESQSLMYWSLIGLSEAYRSLGLIWASNNCLVSAGNISLDSWRRNGVLSRRAYSCAKQLAINEILIGRIPSFLAFHELAKVVAQALSLEDAKEDFHMIDAFLAVRILDLNSDYDKMLSLLPNALNAQALWLSEDSCYFKLGYYELIETLPSGVDRNSKEEVDKWFETLINQPFRDQLMYRANFLGDEVIALTSIILGCKFIITFKAEKELLICAEIMLAYFESFFATSLESVLPTTESVDIEVRKDPNVKAFSFSSKGTATNEYLLAINKFDFTLENRESFWNAIWECTSLIMGRNLFVEDLKSYLENLFKKEEVVERLTLLFEYRKFINNFLGDKSSTLLGDWVDEKKADTFPSRRSHPAFSEHSKVDKPQAMDIENFANVGHDKRTVHSVIEGSLWDSAKWKGFGLMADSEGMGIVIVYENIDAGKQIFENWIKRFGAEDREDKIRLSIIKGVDRRNPNWYRVHIGSGINVEESKSGQYILSASRFHEMTADSAMNLDNLVRGFDYLKKYRFCAAAALPDGRIEPFLDKAIIKRTLTVKNAWEIGPNDLDCGAIKPGDNPVIPSHVNNPPIQQLLDKMRAGGW